MAIKILSRVQAGCMALLLAGLLPGGALGASFTVNMTGFQFSPKDLTVSVGDTVTWVNQDFAIHDTFSGTNGVASGLWGSPPLGNNGQFSFVFNVAPGFYGYYCRPHWFTLNMVGSITVVGANVPPTVTIQNPTNGASFAAGANILVEADASDPEGPVARVDFFVNGNPAGSDASSPFSFVLTNVAAGNYALSAVAFDSQGASSTPAVVNVVVVAGNVAPSVAITNPTSGQTFLAGTNVLVEAFASDSDGSITQVEFFVDGAPVGVRTAPPYSVLLTNLALGDYELSALATDDDGASSTSETVLISVVDAPAPPQIVEPPQSQTVAVGSHVSFSVAASGTPPLGFQWLFNGSILPNETNVVLALTNVQASQAGNYSVIVTNALGSATSAVAVLQIFLPEMIRPTLVITSSPPNFARLRLPQVRLSGIANDDQGLSKIEYQLGESAWQPFVTNIGAESVVWNLPLTLQAGLNTVRVRSVDVAMNTSFAATRYFTFVVLRELRVEVGEGGTVSPDLDGRLLEIGKAYSLTARPKAGYLFAGWEGVSNAANALLYFQMIENLHLVARFATNPFPAVAGSYTGLFLDTNDVTLATSGLLTLQLTKGGTFTGKLRMGTQSHPFQGLFDPQGEATLPVLRRGMKPVVLALEVDLSGTTQSIRGVVTQSIGTNNTIVMAELLAEKKGSTGPGRNERFGLQLAGESEPVAIGDGSAAMSRTGRVQIEGQLVDGPRFQFVGALSVHNRVPWYIPLRNGAELLLGWMEAGEEPEMINGDLLWLRASEEPLAIEISTVGP